MLIVLVILPPSLFGSCPDRLALKRRLGTTNQAKPNRTKATTTLTDTSIRTGTNTPMDKRNAVTIMLTAARHSHANVGIIIPMRPTATTPTVTAPGDGEHEEHNHGWAPWTYAILIIPAVLFFLGLPEDGYAKRGAKNYELDPTVYQKCVAFAHLTGGMVFPELNRSEKVHLRFSDMVVIASRESSRRHYEGKTVTLRGMFVGIPGKDMEFTLKRVKVTCCGADATMLQSRIVSTTPLPRFREEEWVEIEGQLSFAKVAGRDEYVPVIQLPDKESVRSIEKPENADFDA